LTNYTNISSHHSDYIAHLDGATEIPGGWINHNYIQLGYQLADSTAGFAYSFVMTCVILFLMNLVPGLSLRASPEQEEIGLDDGQLGEFAYDYVELERHVTASLSGEEAGTSSHAGSLKGGSVKGGAAPGTVAEKTS